MTIQLQIAAVIDSVQSPDWQAAEDAIDRLKPSSLDDIWDLFEEDSDRSRVTQAEVADVKARAQAQLRLELRKFRLAVEQGHDDLFDFNVRGARVLMTGGVTGGESHPNEVHRWIWNLDTHGVLGAAGFDP